VAKVYAYWAGVNYREAYGMFISNGILFNHESPRRGIEFVTRRITDAVARIATGHPHQLTLGNLDARRDWGYAPDYVEFMWKTLQHGQADDFVGATGEAHSVREFAAAAFGHAGVADWEKHVRTDPKLLRPAEVFNLRGSTAKAEKVLGWKATTRFKELVGLMVDADLARYSRK
jgi:GDPmannose 4,6-dehydratase